MGHSGPIALEALSSAGHWVAYCQVTPDAIEDADSVDPRARDLDTLELFLHVGDEDIPITALLRADSSGRYVVVLIEGTAWLIDAVTGSRWDLGDYDPDLRFDGLSDHRSFAFSSNALFVLSESPDPESSQIWAIDLRDLRPNTPLSSVKLHAPEQVAYRLEAGEAHVHTISLPKNSTTKYWPAQFRKQPVRRCTSQASRYDSYTRLSSYRPDPYISNAWLHLPKVDVTRENAAFEPAPGFVFGLSDGWVRRLDTGRLMLVRGKTQKQIASERCGARILHADERTGQFLIACEEYEPTGKRKVSNKKPKYRYDLYLIRPGHVRSLGADVARTGVDVLGTPTERYVPIRPGAAAALVDLKATKLITLEGDARILAVGRAGALIRRDNQLSLWLDESHPEEQLDYRLPALANVLTRPALVAVGTRIFDLRDGLSTWEVSAPPIALSDAGHALLAQGRYSRDEQGLWFHGPLSLVPTGAPDEREPTPSPALTQGTAVKSD